MIEAIFGLVGVIIGAIITWATTRASERKKNAVSLYSDFSSSDMENVRHMAYNHLIANNKKNDPLSFQEMHSDLQSAELIYVSRMLHFWEKTWYSVKHGYVDEGLTKTFLQHYFEAHYVNVLKDFAEVCRRKDKESYQRWVMATKELAIRWKVS